MNVITFAAEKPDVKVKSEIKSQRAAATKAFLAAKKEKKGKRKKVDSDDDFSVEEISSSGHDSDEFEQDADDELPKAKAKSKARVRKSGEQQYGDGASHFKCGIEGCETTCGHQRNVWEHWRNIHKLTFYYECPLGCANGKTTHFGSFRKHINDHSATDQAQIPDRYKVQMFPGHPLLSDANMKKAQEYNKKESHAYKKTKIKKEEAESGGLAAGGGETSEIFEPLKETMTFVPADPAITLAAALAASQIKVDSANQNSAVGASAAQYNVSAESNQTSRASAASTYSFRPRRKSKMAAAVAAQSQPSAAALAVEVDEYTLLARKILEGWKQHHAALERYEKEDAEAIAKARAMGHGLGAGKSPAGALVVVDDLNAQAASEQPRNVGKKMSIITENNPRWKPEPHRALSATSAPTKVLVASPLAAKEVPLDFDEYCVVQRLVLAQATQLTPEQLQQQKLFAEMALIDAQLALLHKKSNAVLLHDSSLSS